MRPYDRTHWKRFVAREALVGLSDLRPRESRGGGRAASGGDAPPIPETWTRFCRAFEEAAVRQGEDALLPLARCSRYRIAAVSECGAEQPALEAWCGSPYCPVCARDRASRVVRFVRERWAGLEAGVVSIPVGAPGRLELPGTEAVATLRVAWSELTKAVADATGLPRLDASPRTVVTPSELALFFRAPDGDPEERARLISAVAERGQAAGIRGVSAQIVSREAAAMRYYRALMSEGEAFSDLVTADLDRVGRFPWRDVRREAIGHDVSARGWVERVKARAAESRRQLVLGPKSALPAGPIKPRVDARLDRGCPTHGERCGRRSLRVRERRGGEIVHEARPDALGKRPTRQRLGDFFAGFEPRPRPEPRRDQTVFVLRPRF